MVDSVTPRRIAAEASVRAAADMALPEGYSPALPVGVAFSGGADSLALLLLCVQRWGAQGVVALHVNHQLQAASSDFEAHARAQAQTLGVVCAVLRVDARGAAGDSPEAAARDARYKALAELSLQSGCAEVALAHHREDQVESVLIALSRGAGLPGLSGMPARMIRHGVVFSRPLLHESRERLRVFLASQHASWIEDPSNADTQYVRNRIRHALVPALVSVTPAFPAMIVRSAGHAAQAERLLGELALQDLGGLAQSTVLIALLRGLSVDRRANALRFWLRNAHGVQASEAQMTELLRQIAACTTRGHRIRIKVSSGRVERVAANLHWYN
jgi:tRNA(Ile)-lysidine synthase